MAARAKDGPQLCCEPCRSRGLDVPAVRRMLADSRPICARCYVELEGGAIDVLEVSTAEVVAQWRATRQHGASASYIDPTTIREQTRKPDWDFRHVRHDRVGSREQAGWMRVREGVPGCTIMAIPKEIHREHRKAVDDRVDRMNRGHDKDAAALLAAARRERSGIRVDLRAHGPHCEASESAGG